MRWIISKIKKADVLAEAPKLKVNNSSSYQTFIGGLISLSLIFLSIIGSLYFGKELYNKDNPIIIDSISDFDEITPLYLNNSAFEFYFVVEYDNYTYYNNPKVFQFRAYEERIIQIEGVQNLYSRELEMQPCKTYYSKSELNNKIDTDLFYCIKPNSTHIEGFWGNTINQYIRIKLFKCSNTTNITCLPIEAIDKSIEGGILGLYVKNSILKLKDYDNPVFYSFDDLYYSLNTEFIFTLSINLKHLLFQNDIGYLFENIQEVKGFYLDHPKLLYFGKRGDLLADITFQFTRRGNLINRQYLKIQDVLTKIGGLIKALMIIGNFVAVNLSNIAFYNDYIFNIKYNNKLLKEKGILIDSNLNQQIKEKVNFMDRSKKPVTQLSSKCLSELQTIRKISKLSSTKLFIYNTSIEIEKYKRRDLNESNSNYSCIYIMKDFFNYIKSILFDNINFARLFEKKLDKYLSIEYIFEKISLLNKLEEKIFTDKEKNELLSRMYVDLIDKSN